MSLILPSRRNPLVYPNGAKAGSDPTHPAAFRRSIAVVPSGNNVVNLHNGQIGTRAGSPVPVTYPIIGPGLRFGTTADIITFANINADTGNGSGFHGTYAAIFQLDSVGVSGNYQMVGGNTPSVLNNGFIIDPSGSLGLFFGGSTNFNTFGFFPSAGVPYFVAVTFSTGSITAVLVATDLRTGQIRTFFNPNGAVGPATGNDGNFQVGGSAFNQNLGGPLAALMYSDAVLSFSALRKWAADPWSYWYPQRRFSWVGASSGGTTNPKTITVTCTSSVGWSRNIGKFCAIPSTTTTAVTKQPRKTVAVTATTTTSFLKQVAKTIALTCTSTTAAINAIKVKLQTITVGCTTSMAFGAKQVGKVVSVTATSTTAFKRAITHTFAVTCTSAVVAIKAITHKITVGCTSAIAIIATPFIAGGTILRRHINLTIFRK